MKKNYWLGYSALVLILILFLFRVYGIITFSIEELISYAFSIYGISLAYTAFGKNKKADLFIGTVTFMSGVFLFVINKFEFFSLHILIIPAFIFVLASGSLMLFLDNQSDKKLLLVSILFFLSAFIITIILGRLHFLSFFYNLIYIIKSYWIALIILILVVIFIKRED